MTGKDSGKDGRKRPDRQDEDAVADLAYEPSVNQTAHHPMPASRDDDTGQAAVRENEEHWRRSHGRGQSVRNEAEHGKPGSASQAVPAQRRAARRDRPASDREQREQNDRT
jgi:hypothetical protein